MQEEAGSTWEFKSDEVKFNDTANAGKLVQKYADQGWELVTGNFVISGGCWFCAIFKRPKSLQD